jgi:hypothetical protein
VEADFTACEDFFCSGVNKVVPVICVFLLVSCYQSFFVYFDMTFVLLPDGHSILDISSLAKSLVIPGNLFISYKY